jgi:hypothetical protein
VSENAGEWVTPPTEFVDPPNAGVVDEVNPGGIPPSAGAVGVDAIMLALAQIGDELKRIADALDIIGGLLEEPPIQRVTNVDRR